MEVMDYCVATDTTPTRPYRRFRQAAPERTVKTLICPMCLLLDSSDCRSGRASDLLVIPDGLGNQTRRLFCCRHGFLALPERKPSGQAGGLVVGQPRSGFHSIPQFQGIPPVWQKRILVANRGDIRRQGVVDKPFKDGKLTALRICLAGEATVDGEAIETTFPIWSIA
jgi:hypothetical protein